MTLLSQDEIAARRAAAIESIARAAEKSGRAPATIDLLAVTKGQPAEVVLRAARAGCRLFGENRVAEAAEKIQAVRAEFPALTWKLIGPLQTNKAALALQWFAMVESVDRQRLADRLERLLEGSPRLLPVLLEVNLAGEATKSGASAEGVVALARAVAASPHLDCRGVMAVPPFDPDPERARPWFRQLREIRDRIEGSLGRKLPEISAGMSHDFTVAVEEGSTQVRLGTALFGPREEA
ncbi:MAG: YggS family pyridoxal phosphate-dependent enzyme [Thermoanaerobaculia bacterium]